MRSKFKWNLTVLLVFLMQVVFAQEKTISGVVTEGGVPLPGVSVVVKGTTNGTQTDLDGNYSIKAKAGDALVYSFVGMKEQTIIVGSQTKVNIAMQAEATQLTELVVGAMGIKRKPDEITTANQVVKARELTQASNPNVVQSLAGKVSGLQINTTSNGLTPGTDIILRGYRSISADNGALVVIDNVISTSGILSSLDPNTIESINVIKGANGAALYGSLGGNGVIVVTTKKGGKDGGKFTVDFKSSATFEDIAFMPERQDRFGQGWEGAFDWTDQGAWGPEFDGSMQPTGTPYPGPNDYRFYKYEHIEDNIKEFFKTGVTLQNSLTLSSGDENGYFSLSANKQNIDGVIPSNEYYKDFFSLSAGKQAGKFKLSANVRYTTDKTNRATNDTYRSLSNAATNIPIEEFSSGDNYDHWTLYETSPYWSLKNQRAISRNNIFDANADIQYSLNKNIDFVLRSSVRLNDFNQYAYTNEFKDELLLADTDRSVRSRYDSQKQTSRTLYTDLMSNFNYMLTQNLSLKSTLGVNITDRTTDFMAIGGNDLLIPGFYDITNISGIPDAVEAQTQRRGLAVFANVDLGYKDYLYFNLTGRNDWTSVLNAGNNSFFYPSAGASFIATNAFPSLKGNILNKMKISAGIVQVGNANAVNPYALNIRAVQPAGFPFGNLNSFISSVNGADQDLVSELVTSKEINLNLEFLNRGGTPRITLDATGAFSKNEDQILGINPSTASGLNTALINVGKTSTKSFEVDLGFTPIKTQDFQWSGTIGFSTYRTVVDKVSDQTVKIETDFYDVNGDGVKDGGTTVGISAIQGQEFPLITGTAYVRDDQGRVKLDSSGSPVRSSELVVLGKVTPDYILNFSTQFRYKGFRLNAVMDYRTGHSFYSQTANDLNDVGGTIESAQNGREPFLFPNSVVETAPNSGVYVPNTNVLTGGSTPASFQNYIQNNYSGIDENFVYDATALKLREVSLNYDFPSKVLKNSFLTGLSLGVSGRNLFTVLPKANRGYNDPEVGTGLEDFSQTPPTRLYSFSINVIF